jgi:fumarate hydratase subunit beta
MSKLYRFETPLREEDIVQLRAGDKVLFSGVIYTARDAAHKRLVNLIQEHKPLPLDLGGQVIYYAGPSPAPPGRPIGACGPTTSYRMDAYAPYLIALGLRAMIGKGKRSDEVIKAMVKHRAVYLAATGGAGALMSQRIKEADILAYDDLGPEAIWRLLVEDFPAIVVNDIQGQDLYVKGIQQYQEVM